MINNVVNIVFKGSVEVEVHRDHYKVFDLIPLVQVSSPTRSTDVDHTRQPLTTWLVETDIVLQMLESNKCLAIVDRSFFPEYPEFISAY